MNLPFGMVIRERNGRKVSVQKKQYTKEFKQRVIQEALETGNCATVARRHGIAPTIVSRWVRKSKSGAPNTTQPAKPPYVPEEIKRLMAENAKLKRLLGEKDLEIDILTELVKKGNPRWKKE